MNIGRRTEVYALIGDPVSHSLSPFIMNRAFGRLGMDGVYVALRVTRDQLQAAVSGLKALGAAGANVTYPHKESVVSLVDHPSEQVGILGAANVLHFSSGEIRGYNTDASGAAIALEDFGGLSLKGKKVFIFGAGGAGRAAAFGVLEAGAASVTFCVRNLSRAIEATGRLRDHFAGGTVSTIPMEKDHPDCAKRKAISESDIIINATPLGMGALRAFSPIEDPAWIRVDHICFEFNYSPRLTEFLNTARARGATCLDGLCLLVAQARESVRYWTGRNFELHEMAQALEAHTRERLVLKKE